MSHYTMLSKYDNCTRLLKVKNKLKIGCFYKLSREQFSTFCGRFKWKIIPLALVGYKMIIANSIGATLLVGYLPSHIQRALVE